MSALVLPGVSIRLVQDLVCDRCGVTLLDLTSPSRKRDVAWPRQIAMSLCREFTRKSLNNIGRHFGGRDHTTVISAVRAVARRNETRADQRQIHGELWALLNQISPKPAEEDMPDLYAELGVARDATSEEIKAAHRNAVRQHHPDRGGDKSRFQAVQLAYDTLKDEEKRKRYDRTGETAGAEQPDPAVQMLGMIVDNLINQMLQDGVPIETVDMRKMMVDAVKGKMREIAQERAGAERAARKAAALAKRWKRKRKAKGPDLIGDTIRRKERDIKETVVRMKDAEDAWGRASKLLDDYEYKFDAPPTPEWSGTGGFRFAEFIEFGTRS